LGPDQYLDHSEVCLTTCGWHRVFSVRTFSVTITPLPMSIRRI
jgi:hypothetical protein